ncbi:hypothetical protein EJ03DRAFT_135714 [Teratosphaeria nubilosa]|uniref:Uncharacterized protein n=1 Tax=Teratosphaeria nubilosa TaxID=161662 RepID=A0A6G1L601_9PEZI|nr:hypothetical protein EJ03DRAFT_135714 [Teratosphaeria nubilosa]
MVSTNFNHDETRHLPGRRLPLLLSALPALSILTEIPLRDEKPDVSDLLLLAFCGFAALTLLSVDFALVVAVALFEAAAVNQSALLFEPCLQTWVVMEAWAVANGCGGDAGEEGRDAWRVHFGMSV